MPTTSALRAIVSLLVAVLFMVTANGLLATVVPVRARIEGMTATEIGLMSSFYFVGMLAGAMGSPWLVRRSGHVLAFSVTVALAAVATLAMAAILSPHAWVAARGVMGFSFAVLYSTVESWLQGKSDDSVRGRVLAIYSVIQYGGQAGGNVLFGFSEPASFEVFSLVAALLCLAILPLGLSTQAPPKGPNSHSLRLAWFFRLSPVGFVAAIFIGMANGPHWSLSPIYAADVGMDKLAVGTFMTAMTVGAALGQLPIGRLSDLLDRRLVLILICVAAAAIELAMWLAGPHVPHWVLFAAFFLVGAFLAPQYYVVAAHANDRIGVEHAVTVASALLFLYCIGAIVGPLTATVLMERIGPGGLFVHNALVHLAMAAFVVWRMRVRARPVPVDQIEDLPRKPMP